jgi:hypothetical protein
MHAGEKDVTIKPDEELVFVILKKEKCHFCKQNSDRTIGRKKPGGKTRHF